MIYTGLQNWTVKTRLAEKQYFLEEYKNYQSNFWYNLVAIQDYTFEELLEKKTLFSSFMIMEKCRNKEELIKQLNKIIETINNKEEGEILLEIIANVIVPQVGQEVANEMLQKIKKKEETGMSPLTKMLFDLEIESEKKGERHGILKTAKKMLQRNMKIAEIEEITGLSKNEIEKLESSI